MNLFLKHQAKIPATLTLVLVVFSLHGQDFKNRLMQIKNEYASLETVHMEMSIQIFETKDTDNPYFKESANVKRQFDNYFCQFGSIDMLMNSKYLLMVDKSSREIFCTKRSSSAEQKLFTDPFEINMDSVLAFYENPRHIGKSNGIEHYSLEQKKGIVRQIDLFIDEKENIIKRIAYVYRDGQYVVIDFTIFDKRPDFGNFRFQEATYVTLENGKFEAAANFRGYNVIQVDSR